MLFKILFLIALGSTPFNAVGQLYLGLTGDFGNKVTNSPTNPDELLKRSITPSAALIVLSQNRISDDWCVRYGISFGSLGYNVKALSYDSSSSIQSRTYESFLSYGTLYLNGNVQVGRHFPLGPQIVTVLFGGGLTVYRNWSEEGKLGKSPDVITFEYYMNRKDNKPKGFAEVTFQTNITDRFVIGVRYLHHLNTALQGNYKFNQAKSSGQLSLEQRTLSIMFLVRVTSN